MPVSFSTVIATRNRAEALALSLPLHLSQSRLPDAILVIDSSDDPSANRELVARLAATTAIPVTHQASAPGSALQRNIGLGQIGSDVVFFPDDDSLVHPDALARMMRIYDLDPDGRIGGVCAAEARLPPEGVLSTPAAVYQKRRSDRIRSRIGPMRRRLEDRYFPDPMKLAAARLQQDLPPPEPWLARENAVRVEWMTGFRMSFRTDLVRQVSFNEHLGRYALYEDIDVGLRIQAAGHSLVGAEDALIYHHKSPEYRTNGRQMGVINILNRAYVVLRSRAADDSLKKSIRRHALFRVSQFAAGARTKYGQERLAGAFAAYRALPALLASPASRLDETYLGLRQTCLEAAS